MRDSMFFEKLGNNNQFLRRLTFMLNRKKAPCFIRRSEKRDETYATLT